MEISGIFAIIGGLVICLIAVIAMTADRSARAAAWRQIALERRWNQERRRTRLSSGNVEPRL